jgi:hypothetical protein
LQQVHQADGAFKGDGVEGNEGFFARFGFDILKYFFFVIDEIVTGGVWAWELLRERLQGKFSKERASDFTVKTYDFCKLIDTIIECFYGQYALSGCFDGSPGNFDEVILGKSCFFASRYDIVGIDSHTIEQIVIG